MPEPQPAQAESTRTRALVVCLLAGLGFVGAGLLWEDRRCASQIEDLHATLAAQRQHIESFQVLQDKCIRAHAALIERWIATPEGIVWGPAPLRALDDIRMTLDDLAKLPPSDPDESEARNNLHSAVQRWSKKTRRVVESGEGPEHVTDLRDAQQRIAHWSQRVLQINFAASRRADENLRAVDSQRTLVEVAFGAVVAAMLALGVWWRARVLATARLAQTARAASDKSASLRAEFFTNMSHELRTPLVAISGFATQIENGAKDPSVRDAGKKITRASKDLLGIINNILDVAKLESDHTQFLLEPVAVDEVIERCASRCQGLVGDKHLELCVALPKGLPRVKGDFVKLQQVFTNLIGNAIKFTESGSVNVRAWHEKDHVFVEVADTGVGIEPAALASIWDRFRQADHKVSRKYGGSGLGLAIVRGVLGRIDGAVNVESTVGVGTTFTVKLRVDAAARDRLANAPPKPA